jgi:hypothetical protein
MSFLSKKNSDMLFDLITEECINVDYSSFNKMLLEFGQINGTRHSLMEMNKQFIRHLITNYGRTQSNPTGFSEQQFHSNSNISTNMPSRPQGSRSKNVSFDEQLELHKQHFQQYAAPPPPTPPIFKDEESNNSSDLEVLMKKALSERKYDVISSQQNTRKLHIGSVIEDEKHKEDLIDIDKLTKQQPQQQPQQPQPELSSFGFFSKLKMFKQSEEQDLSSPTQSSLQNEKETETEPENKVISTNQNQNELDILKDNVARLEHRLEETDKKIDFLLKEMSLLKNTYNPELKETSPLNNK